MMDYLRLARESAARERVRSSPAESRGIGCDKRDVSDESPVDASPAAPIADPTERLETLSAPPGSARKALMEVLASDASLRARFEKPCLDSAAALREEVLAFRAVLKQHGHVFRDHRCEHEETAGALYELAGDLLPDSAAAALALLRRRVRGRQEVRTVGEAVEGMAASEHEWFDALVLLSGSPPDQERLRAVAQRIWHEFRGRGQRHEPRDFSDHVWTVVKSLFPGSPGAAWDSEWAACIRSDVERDLANRVREAGLDRWAVDESGVDAALAEMAAFEEAGDRCGFRSAARRALRETRRAVSDAS